MSDIPQRKSVPRSSRPTVISTSVNDHPVRYAGSNAITIYKPSTTTALNPQMSKPSYDSQGVNFNESDNQLVGPTITNEDPVNTNMMKGGNWTGVSFKDIGEVAKRAGNQRGGSWYDPIINPFRH